jgi:hypothetical protein
MHTPLVTTQAGSRHSPISATLPYIHKIDAGSTKPVELEQVAVGKRRRQVGLISDPKAD